MQKKHRWDQLLKLHGNVEQDFEKVIQLLEEHGIHDKKYMIKEAEPFLFPKKHPKILKTIYEKKNQ